MSETRLPPTGEGQQDPTEADTRNIIDEQLRAAGWEADTQRLRHSANVRPQPGRNLAIAEWPVGTERADYALFAGRRFIGIVEAKRKHKDIFSDLAQARSYAQAVKPSTEYDLIGTWDDYRVPFVFAANGRNYIKQFETKSGVCFHDIRIGTNTPRPVYGFHSPEGLLALLRQNAQASVQKLREDEFDYLADGSGLGLRSYQIEAVRAVERELEAGKRAILLAMATGTGKTRTALALCYRLLKANRFRRILFLVDRTILGAQALGSFNSVKIEDFKTFGDIYDVVGPDEGEPQADTRLKFATVQSIARRIASPEPDESLPAVDTYDCIVVDEVHRGYILDREIGEGELEYRNTDDFISTYRRVLDYFDAVRIGLTATPAVHTVQIFGKPVYEYLYRRAVLDGVLVDREPSYVIQTELQRDGIHWQVGERPVVYDVDTHETVQLDELDVALTMNIDQFNKKVLTENFNRVVVQELVKNIDPEGPGKTLIFCANDSHADLVVQLLYREFENTGVDVDHRAIEKITGSVRNHEERVRAFANERLPVIAATVDLLTTGIDVEEIDTLVFIRPVKSRILYEQMLGRATRRADHIGKEFFRVFDAVGVCAAMDARTDMKPVVQQPSRSFSDLLHELDRISDDSERRRQVEEIVAKFRRVRQNITRRALERMQHSLGRSVDAFFSALSSVESVEQRVQMLLDNTAALAGLDDRRKSGTALLVSEHEDRLIGVSRNYGESADPGEYLERLGAYLQSNINTLPALRIVCTRPAELTRKALLELRATLEEQGFSEAVVRTAWHQARNSDVVADIIAVVRTLALGEPFESYEHRVHRAFDTVKKSRSWSVVQLKWLQRIEEQMVQQTVLDREAFDTEPFMRDGGFARINKIFDNSLEDVLGKVRGEIFTQAG